MGTIRQEVYMKKRLCFLFVTLMAASVAALAKDPPAAPANPIAASEKGFYTLVSGELIAAAQEMPEQNYSFKPTPDVRSFGQLVGHVADAQYFFCSTAAGEPNPIKEGIEKTKTSKADLVAALKDAVAYCDKTYSGMTDAQGAQMAKFLNFDLARLTILSVNTAHADEHYGNMVTYLRLKSLVPPSSQPRGNRPQSKD
jgi:uncharacterized damage-inducible protein DinB